MRSDATTVEAYVATSPIERRAALEALRQACREALPDHAEGMAYGMPTYRRGDTPEIAFASQKGHIALYVMRPEVVEEHRAALDAAQVKVGKGCVTFARPERIPFDLVRAILAATARPPAGSR